MGPLPPAIYLTNSASNHSQRPKTTIKRAKAQHHHANTCSIVVITHVYTALITQSRKYPERALFAHVFYRRHDQARCCPPDTKSISRLITELKNGNRRHTREQVKKLTRKLADRYHIRAEYRSSISEQLRAHVGVAQRSLSRARAGCIGSRQMK